VLLLCQIPTALVLVATVIESLFRPGHFDGAALYAAAGVVAALMLCTGGVGLLLDRRARRRHPEQTPTLRRSWWRLQAMVLVPSQLGFVLAGLVVATFSLGRPRQDWGEGALGYLAFSGAYFGVIALPLLAPAWLLTRPRRS
jgi:hypothetical protein